MTKIKLFSFVHTVLCDAQQSLCLSFDPGTGSDLFLLDLSLSPQLSVSLPPLVVEYMRALGDSRV